MSDWTIFRGDPKKPHDATESLMTHVPPWRDFKAGASQRARTYQPTKEQIRVVNAALHLRRPLLVTGPPGCGKSSLAYAIAEELKLNPVLKWPVNSRTTLTDGLYNYDAIARLRDYQLEQSKPAQERKSEDVAEYLQLQWLGTAFASPTPRVILIDEIDKADIDLPNDLLHVLEEGSFVIPELQRIADNKPSVPLRTCEPNAARVEVKNGAVSCGAFPIIVLTSNGERDLPMAFHRRCLRLDIRVPDTDELLSIVKAHLKYILDKPADSLPNAPDAASEVLGVMSALRDRFVKARANRVLSTDQLMNVVYLTLDPKVGKLGDDADAVEEILFRGLDQ